MWKKKKGFMLVLPAILFFTALIISLSSTNTIGAKEPAERFKGYNKQRDKWTVGNLGKAYVEGDFVSYQLRIDKTSKVWGATEFSISFNFHQRNSKAIYVDGFDTSKETGFQWSVKNFLPDGKPIPETGWGTYIPTPDATGEPWALGEPKITNYMHAWPPGTSDGSPPGSYPAEERYFTVYDMPWTEATTHIILFFRAHLALDIIWSEGLETALPTELDGDEFEGWTDAWKGASFATGSSRHFYLQATGSSKDSYDDDKDDDDARCRCIGGKTIPIPIAKCPKKVINGHKYVNDVLFNGWEITLAGQLSLGLCLPPIPYTPPPVCTGTPPWTTGYFEFTALVAGNYTVQEEHRSGYTHEDIVTSGDGTNEIKNISEGWVSFYLPGCLEPTRARIDFYNSAYEDLIVSKTATPSWEQTFTWTIVKTATPTVSEIFVGDTADVKYTITVTAAPTTNIYEVSGTITINNPYPPSVVVNATILDEVRDGVVLIGSKDMTPGGPILIPSGVSTYDYSITLSDIVVGKTYTNKVTVGVTEPVSETYFAQEEIFFTEPTELVDEKVDVEDTLYPGDFLGTVHYSDSPMTFEYTKTFGPYSTVGSNTIDNTATATGTDTGREWTASATVEIDIFDITVSKNADTHWERVFKWSIEKLVEAAQLQPFKNDQIEVKYTINVVKAVDTDTFSVSGTVTIVNNNPDKSAEVEVIDKIYDGASFITSKDLGTHTIVPLGTLNLPYEITFAAESDKTYTNKAHVHLNNYHWNYTGVAIGGVIGTTEFIGSTTFTFTEPNDKINDEVTVTDLQTVPAGLALVSSDYPTDGWLTNVDTTFVVNKIVKALEVGTWDLDDQASAAGDTQTWYSGWKTLTFNVYDIGVSKTATPWWTKSYNWTIDKSVDPTELILHKGETDTVTYTVTITKTLDGDEYKVNGTITIVNNNPEKDAVVYMVDKIYDGMTEVYSLDLGGPYTVEYGTPKTIDYEIFFTPEALKTYTNVAHVNLTNYLWKLAAPKEELPYKTKFTGDDDFTFTTPTKIIDDSATVEEDETVPPEFSHIVWGSTHGDPPWFVTDSTVIVFKKNIAEVSATPCTWYDLPNTVTLTESDTGTVRQAWALVKIHVTKPPENPPSFDFEHASIPDVIFVCETQTLTIRVANTGPSQSRIYYLTFAAVIDGYDFLQFVGPDYTAHVTIYYNDDTTWEIDVTGVLTPEEFSGFGTPGYYWMVTWRVPTTYPDGPYLEGNDGGRLKARAEISFEVKGVAQGPTWLAFFPRATEDHHTNGVPFSEISDAANIWESNGLWYPVHNSYDPYDNDIGTGHVFLNPTWMAVPTTHEYSRVLKFVYVYALS